MCWAGRKVLELNKGIVDKSAGNRKFLTKIFFKKGEG